MVNLVVVELEYLAGQVPKMPMAVSQEEDKHNPPQPNRQNVAIPMETI